MRDSSCTAAPEGHAKSLLLGALLPHTKSTEHPIKDTALDVIPHGQARKDSLPQRKLH